MTKNLYVVRAQTKGLYKANKTYGVVAESVSDATLEVERLAPSAEITEVVCRYIDVTVAGESDGCNEV